jgi:hypothetical protein
MIAAPERWFNPRTIRCCAIAVGIAPPKELETASSLLTFALAARFAGWPCNKSARDRAVRRRLGRRGSSPDAGAEQLG